MREDFKTALMHRDGWIQNGDSKAKRSWIEAIGKVVTRLRNERRDLERKTFFKAVKIEQILAASV